MVRRYSGSMRNDVGVMQSIPCSHPRPQLRLLPNHRGIPGIRGRAGPFLTCAGEDCHCTSLLYDELFETWEQLEEHD